MSAFSKTALYAGRTDLPPLEFWPERPDTRDAYGRSPATARKHWLEHPDLFATEFRVHPRMSAIVATRKAPRP